MIREKIKNMPNYKDQATTEEEKIGKGLDEPYPKARNGGGHRWILIK
jgi:hypothetical protein